MITIPVRVAAGVALLDARDPGWWEAGGPGRPINLDTLNLADGACCVLGQRCPDATLARHLGFEGDGDRWPGYQAYAAELSGIETWDDPDGWCAARGFTLTGALSGWDELTAEWVRVISGHRAALSSSAQGAT